MRSALTGAAAVGGHHHRVDSRVLDDVLPVDGVSVTQELVLVDVHASAQDLCGERERSEGVILSAELVEASRNGMTAVENTWPETLHHRL